MEIEPMPKNIATAINSVMMILDKPLKQDAKNDYQKYSYTSRLFFFVLLLYLYL